jgi:UDP-N-acetyl-D-glucosamine dehydrogenase
VKLTQAWRDTSWTATTNSTTALAKASFGARILIVGIAYKKNIDDMRESHALTIMESLDAAGARVDYHEPYFPVIPPTRRHAALAGKASVPLEGYNLARYDGAVIVTDHDKVDYTSLLRYSKLIVDTRNVLARVAGRDYLRALAKRVQNWYWSARARTV